MEYFDLLIYTLIAIPIVSIVAVAGIILMGGMNGRRDDEDG